MTGSEFGGEASIGTDYILTDDKPSYSTTAQDTVGLRLLTVGDHTVPVDCQAQSNLRQRA
ncbi:hypothetical protein SAMN05216555_102381 [Arthrobacter cupressi]|uniref:Uncharacterized protein n=1 Tax=Arthrobacter cupressi TaxID=1045773 RepID=A0A1G8KVY1_9MICC|nr:hypothetical protein [Arthrobacter cupressi]SDI47507.1 hypothetical protein SAMN05216555_102381 [Arthrobacter cupressi]